MREDTFSNLPPATRGSLPGSHGGGASNVHADEMRQQIDDAKRNSGRLQLPTAQPPKTPPRYIDKKL